MAKDKVPVTILTGFLGSGKTTLLNHILTAQHGKKIAVIENEFGEVGIDDALIKPKLKTDTEEDVIEMMNGCICCTVRQDLVEVATARARHPSHHALCALLRVDLERRNGRLEPAAQEATRAAETYGESTPEVACRLWNEAGDCWLAGGQAAHARRCHERAVALLPRVTDAFLPIETEVVHARLLLDEGQLEETRSIGEAAREASRLLRYPR